MDWRDKPCFTIPEDAKLTDLSLSWQGRGTGTQNINRNTWSIQKVVFS